MIALYCLLVIAAITALAVYDRRDQRRYNATADFDQHADTACGMRRWGR